jgi:hypothetical protein
LQGFQAELSTKKYFLSYQQYKREALSDFFLRFLHLKAQAPEVSDEQVITQAIKTLCTGQLHSYPVRGWPRTLQELYDNFCKFSRSEVLHFRKLDQKEKFPRRTKPQDPPSTTRVVRAQWALTMHTSRSTTSTRTDAGHHKTRRKFLDLRNPKTKIKPSTLEKITITIEAACHIRFCDQRQILIACVSRIIYSTHTDKKCS